VVPGMPSNPPFPSFSVLAPLVFFALVGDGTALCALGGRAPAAAEIVMTAVIPLLVAALGALVLILDRRSDRDDGDDWDDWRGGGGWRPPGDRGPGGDPAWWPRFEAELRDYIRGLERSQDRQLTRR
jgi:hypothetical protein